MKYEVKEIATMPGEIGRLLRCIYMALGCISPHSPNLDERLAWLRLSDALLGREPRNNIRDYDEDIPF